MLPAKHVEIKSNTFAPNTHLSFEQVSLKLQVLMRLQQSPPHRLTGFSGDANGNDMEMGVQYLCWTTARNLQVSYLLFAPGMNLTALHQSYPLPDFVRDESGDPEVE